MNNRIKQLMDQAGIDVEAVESLGEMPTALKFAELLIQECTSLLFEESERLYAYASECDNLRHSDEADICAEKCVDLIAMIEEHFGVE
jgi:hypothetical protein